MPAFRATYSDFKLVKTRKVAQFIFEVPVEAVDEALGVVGGMPNGGEERWFGIAPLRADAPIREPELTDRAKKNWRDMLPSAQAAIRCTEASFRVYLQEEKGYGTAQTTEEAAEAVRDFCKVASRAELNTDHKARTIWFGLDSEFIAWKAAEHA